MKKISQISIVVYSFAVFAYTEMFSQNVSQSPQKQNAVEWEMSVLNDTITGDSMKAGNPRTVHSPFGEAVEFDGVGDAFFLDESPLQGLEQFTVEVMFRPDAGGLPAQRFLHMGELSGDRVMLETRLTRDNQWYLDAYLRSHDTAVTLFDSLKTHPTGRWHHVAFVVDGGVMDTYVDGKHELNGRMRFSPLKPGKTSIGVRRNRIHWFKGAIGKIRITPRVLLPSEFIKPPAAAQQRDARLDWWREARFGLFIHWGLYAIPAGEWGGKTEYGEWIREQAHIPLEEYNQFVARFNPVQFNATEWVRMAKDAGMNYIVITSKHHDGFCLFDSKETDFDVMSTPFKRDILKELSDACKKAGITLCFYYSIMDWHHPDYLPRRDWEKNLRPPDGNLDRYILHMKRQLKELVERYGPLGVLWFDGEWESTWSSAYGVDLYNYVRSLQQSIIINNRVGVGRSGMQGLTKAGEFGGDFGTPEQEVPPMGLPGIDWESCMTMNQHWGYNKHDDNWKSGPELIRTLVDIASKGGNYLLNIGPTAEGSFPAASIERLQFIGAWMKRNSESIYGTTASPFPELPWGRCTQKEIANGTRFYLHVFDWPTDGNLVLPGLLDSPARAFLLTNSQKAFSFNRKEDAVVVHVGTTQSDAVNTVIVLEFDGSPEIAVAPAISSEYNIFIDRIDVSFGTETRTTEVRYTLDGSVPTVKSPVAKGSIRLTATTLVSARLFRDGKPVSPVARATFTKVAAQRSEHPGSVKPGVNYAYYEGEWNVLPDFGLMRPLKQGSLANFDLSPRKEPDHFGFVYDGYIRIPATAVYTFFTESDDGSRLSIGDSLLVDNDGLHAMVERTGVIALEAGLHRIRVVFFEKSGGEGLNVSYAGSGIPKQAIPDSVLFRRDGE